MANYAPLIARLEEMDEDFRDLILDWQKTQEECGFDCANFKRLKERLHARERKRNADALARQSNSESDNP